jgi:hypothetical protein
MNRLVLMFGLLLTFAGLSLWQARGQSEPRRPKEPMPVASSSVQDALVRPYSFPFARPTPLASVAEHLRTTLDAPVVIDQAALDRLGLREDDTVRLSLDGVRLKTGLKLLLDQLGMTYRVEPEDNLLILTDRDGSEDPYDRILRELESLHRDVHDVQDAIDYLYEDLGLSSEPEPAMRKPTIIEPAPEGGEGPEPKPQPDPKARRRT